MNANIAAVEQTNEETIALGDRITNGIEDAACCVYESTVSAIARTEVFVTALTKATPRIREVAKTKAEQRMAVRLAKYN